MTALLLLFGDAAPKRFAVRRPEILARSYLPLLRFFIVAFTPIRILLERITHWLPKHLIPAHHALTEDELLTAVDVGHEEGILTKEERTMVDGIIRLETLQARDVMTPRVDLIGIDLNGNPNAYPDLCRKARFRFLPVYRNDLDHIEGFLETARFLLNPDAGLLAAMHPHFYVPDTSPLDSLLTMFQQQSKRLAIVIDEYGGTAGLITRGDIQDEIAQTTGENTTDHTLSIEPAGPNRWLINGTTSLEQINYDLDLSLESEGADRIAGWITVHTGRIPKTGDVIEEQGCRVTVLKMRKHRITMVQIEKTGATPATEIQQEQEGPA
jgi:putative hemolysin